MVGVRLQKIKPTGVIYCEGNFGQLDGKTANGLIQHCEAYNIVSVIDSSQAGRDTGQMLTGSINGIPIVSDLSAAISEHGVIPDIFIYGLAPSTGRLSQEDREVIGYAITQGIHIVCGLHEFLGDDPEFKEAAKKYHVSIRDVRKPRPNHELRIFDGSIRSVAATRIAIMGTDCAIGKRTTATLLEKALNAQHVKTVLVTTGQTGLMQGARYGIAMDALPSQFCAGELEGCITRASIEEKPDIILIEGQGALGHPAFCTSALILRGSMPQAVILQHAPNRNHRCDFPGMALPDLADEIRLIEAFSDTKVIGVTINHEGMSEKQQKATILNYKARLGLPVCDALVCSQKELAAMVTESIPMLVSNQKRDK